MQQDQRRPAVPVPAWVRGALWFGLIAVVAYVAGWIVAGWRRPGYDVTHQAISELFELGAPWGSRGLLLVGLVLSGLAFLWLAPALHRVLPGRDRSGPALIAVAGVGTLGVVAAPCTAGCPGVGESPTDTWHAITAGVGYGALVAAPLAFGWRLRHALPGVAAWSAGIGGVAVVLFGAYAIGLVEAAPGLQQRVFNTVADAWYVLIVAWLLREDARARRRGPVAARHTMPTASDSDHPADPEAAHGGGPRVSHPYESDL